MTTDKSRKRLYLINRDFQLRYTYSAVIVGLISTLLTCVVILAPLYIFKILRIPNFLPAPVLGGMAAAAIINIFLVGLMGIIVTHKIAGPMYSLVREFRRIESGRWNTKLRLRRDDDMKFVVRNFNEMVNGILRLCQADVDKIEQLLTTETDPDKKAILNELLSSYQQRLLEAQDADQAIS